MKLKNNRQPIGARSATRCTKVPLIEAIMQAAEEVGNPDNQGRDGTIGFLKWMATKEPRTFGTLLARALPLQKTADPQVEAGTAKAEETFMTKLIGMTDRLPEDYVPQSVFEAFAVGLRQYQRAHNIPSASLLDDFSRRPHAR